MSDTQNNRDNASPGNQDNSNSQPENHSRNPSVDSRTDAAFQTLLRSSSTTDTTGNQSSISIENVSLSALQRLLSGRLVRLTGNDIAEEEDELEEEEEDDDDEDYYATFHRHSHNWFPDVTDPQEAGMKLLKSGDFGRVGPKLRSREGDLNISKTIFNRSVRPTAPLYREEYTSNLVPNTNGTTVASYGANIYTAQFSDDSSFYYTCAQDFRLHIFDTTVPRDPWHGFQAFHRLGSSLQTTMHVRKTIQGHPGLWTITDANLSPDNERMIYASITPTVYMTSTAPDGSTSQVPIPFSDPRRRGPFYNTHDDNFGIWSCRFSADGNEVVAGGSGKLFVYDLLANKRTVKINAHHDDVNSCCWADTASGNVLVSASDDTFLKVWDRRSLGSSQKPSGVLIGHTEGITYVSAKGDGRYIISNGKDQALRLWDLRKMRTSAEYEAVSRKSYGVDGFDYRLDSSFVFLRVLDTIPGIRIIPNQSIRPIQRLQCYDLQRPCRVTNADKVPFQPAETTGGQYLYSGSADGKIHIWSLDGRVVQILDRSRTLPSSFDASGPEPEATSGARTNTCVRDVRTGVDECWMGKPGGSTIARHEWKGLRKAPGAIEDWVEKSNLEEAELESERRHSRRVEGRRRAGRQLPGSFYDDDELMF
ncbi:WD40-repeat-containing domain protein [Cyathus striatus]|nr:WD40-repeat-containing domain protein [Cyathus striatus]